jgi:hypothetical protein
MILAALLCCFAQAPRGGEKALEIGNVVVLPKNSEIVRIEIAKFTLSIAFLSCRILLEQT